ncbi:proline-rich receptor-like protein kinase PERK15 [Zingiber officinale]|uniref:proline-rich receptor-like protein kinase PERK15 n=1 Tax=Zingiber officinale TaxID=94328 RepID=UPI001C4D3AAF|nr:proline-rich receptor-like protein kinase PERK15 [Zingiber officinale]
MTSSALILCYMLAVVCLQLIVDARHVRHISAAMTTSPSAAPIGGWNQVSSLISLSKVEKHFLENLPNTREHREYSLPLAETSPMMFKDSVDYRSLTTVRLPSPRVPSLVNSFLDHSIHPSTELAVTPSPSGYSPPTHSNASTVPTAFAEPPLSPQTECCEPNMVQKRGTQDCHCVYPVKVELFLQNVSMILNWSNEFLRELAYQLRLHMDQFEIKNFYVVGASGLNITMDIVPYKGISFLVDQVITMNTSLALHMIHINPELVGDYKLLNLTWFRPLASPPAPSQSISPVASPSGLPYLPTFTTKGDTGDRKHSNFLLVIGICISVLIVVTFVLLILCLCSCCKAKEVPAEEVKSRTADAVSVEGSLPYPTSTRFLSYEELKEATYNFEPGSLLGEGGFGRVFKGVLSDGTAVAIKKLSGGGHQGDKEFLVEVEMLSRLHHRNLVKLIGYYTSRDSSQNLLCYELVPNGSLESWLHGSAGANCPLDWDTRMKIALDAARGLAYLHEDSQPCVIHRDFKTSNILLENNFHAKVSDFGLAKQAPEGRANYLSTRVMGTFGYVAPEYAMTGHLVVKSDVYSYGVVLLELLTGRKPVDMSQPSGQENLVNWARPILRDSNRFEELADPRLAGKYPKDDFVRVCTIAAACVAQEANQRPTMGEVVQSLKMVYRVADHQDALPTPSTHPNNKQATTYESDATSSMFSSGPFSGLSLFDNDNINRTAVFSEDLHEGR